MSRRARTLLLVSQVYVPDPASVGQHLADLAAEVVRRGYRVLVLTSARGYDDPSARFAPRETLDGVEVRRLPLSSTGKGSIVARLVGQALFLAQATARGMFTRDLAAVLVSTSPPMAAMAALAIAGVRRVPIVYWAMDINPDQVVSLGLARQGSPWVRLFEALNRRILSRARAVITLDRFMAARLNRKMDVSGKLEVFPPWPHEDHIEAVEHANNPFRERHGLAGKFVVMYSGNHGPTNPFDTVLEAAKRLAHRPDIVFAFVGGGIGKRSVDRVVAGGAANVVSLPYQPLAELRYSLSAADVHLVTVGGGTVGIVHPCKVYGAMAAARPILYLGPRPSHVTDLLDLDDMGWHVEHGDVDGAVDAVLGMAGTDPKRLADMGARARKAIDTRFGKAILCARFADIVERVIQGT